jgi:tetratricopeptide (TPR) repeat protein
LTEPALSRRLVVARKQARPLPATGPASPFRNGQEWEEHFLDAIERLDHSFDNGAGAFAAIVNVASDAEFDEMFATYPYRPWIDVETRQLPPVSQEERRCWRELGDEKEAGVAELRARGAPDYAASIRLWEELRARAEALDLYHPFVTGLLASLRHDYGDASLYAEQAVVARRLLEIHTRYVGSDDPAVFIDWIVLAGSLNLQDFPGQSTPKDREAEVCYRRALRIAERHLSPDDEKVRSDVHQFGQYYLNRRCYRRAEALLDRLIRIDEERVEHALREGGDGAPSRAISQAIRWLITDLSKLERLYEQQRRYAEAEAAMRHEIALGNDLPDTPQEPVRRLDRLALAGRPAQPGRRPGGAWRAPGGGARRRPPRAAIVLAGGD